MKGIVIGAIIVLIIVASVAISVYATGNNPQTYKLYKEKDGPRYLQFYAWGQDGKFKASIHLKDGGYAVVDAQFKGNDVVLNDGTVYQEINGRREGITLSVGGRKYAIATAEFDDEVVAVYVPAPGNQWNERLYKSEDTINPSQSTWGESDDKYQELNIAGSPVDQITITHDGEKWNYIADTATGMTAFRLDGEVKLNT